MKWKVLELPKIFKTKKRDPNIWWAWYPVKCYDDYWRWLEYVKVEAFCSYNPYDPFRGHTLEYQYYPVSWSMDEDKVDNSNVISLRGKND